MDLIASYWTVAGNTYPGDGSEVSPIDLRPRMEAAAAAGFNGAGFAHRDLLSLKARHGWKEVKAILDGNGIKQIELEVLQDWFAAGERRLQSDQVRRDLLDAAEGLGARHLKVIADKHGGAWPVGALAEEFAVLCDQAEAVGCKVGIEIMTFTGLNTIHKALEITREANCWNGGVVLDIWHLVRGGVDFGEIDSLAAEELVSIELNDAVELRGALWDDTRNNRLPCGEGSFDLDSFMKHVKATGYEGTIGVEILSKSHRKLPVKEAVAIAFNSARPFVQ